MPKTRKSKKFATNWEGIKFANTYCSNFLCSPLRLPSIPSKAATCASQTNCSPTRRARWSEHLRSSGLALWTLLCPRRRATTTSPSTFHAAWASHGNLQSVVSSFLLSYPPICTTLIHNVPLRDIYTYIHSASLLNFVRYQSKTSDSSIEKRI